MVNILRGDQRTGLAGVCAYLPLHVGHRDGRRFTDLHLDIPECSLVSRVQMNPRELLALETRSFDIEHIVASIETGERKNARTIACCDQDLARRGVLQLYLRLGEQGPGRIMNNAIDVG